MKDWIQIRPDGQEAPFIPLWKFKVRFPVVHFRWEWPDYIQGLIMCAVCLSIIPVLQENLKMPFEVALAIVCLNGFLYLWHAHLGDPVVPGWVTPAIPLIILYVTSFPAEGPVRMHALIAFQLVLGIWCFFLGATGLAKKVISLIPTGIKSGIILGAGIAAVMSVFRVGGHFDKMPITITLCVLVGLYMMYNMHFRDLAERNIPLRRVATLGILPCIVAAIIIAPIVGEAPFTIQWGFSRPDFGTLWTDWVPWGKLGWPSMDMYLKAIPLVLTTYIVIFGDAVQANAIIREADPLRPDDPAKYDPDRTHLIVGMRNGIMSIIAPDISMCGPIWAAMTVVTTERWKKGRKGMDCLIGGCAAFRWGTFTGYWLMPIVTMTRPILPAAFALTMVIQGFVSVYVGARESRCLKDLGVAGIVAGTLLARNAGWAFAAGFITCAVIYGVEALKSVKIGEERIWVNQEKMEQDD